MTTPQTLDSIARELGLEGKLWQNITRAEIGYATEAWQFTDLKNGITFYMPVSATLDQVWDRYKEKRTQFSETIKP